MFWRRNSDVRSVRCHDEVFMKSTSIRGWNALLTASFVVAATLSAVIFEQPFRTLAVVVSLTCFSIGIIAFLLGYWAAVQRSRRDVIGVAALFFLLGDVADKQTKRQMNTCFALQSAVALATALARPETDGKPGSTLAFGILVPMLGLGLNGLWGSRHGHFDARADVASTEVSKWQDEDHE